MFVTSALDAGISRECIIFVDGLWYISLWLGLGATQVAINLFKFPGFIEPSRPQRIVKSPNLLYASLCLFSLTFVENVIVSRRDENVFPFEPQKLLGGQRWK